MNESGGQQIVALIFVAMAICFCLYVCYERHILGSDIDITSSQL
jgi:hypothetical protein